MRARQWLIGPLAGAAGILLWSAVLYAQNGYALTWFSVDGGGGSSSGGVYSLYGVAGQSDTAQLSGGSYTLTGGVLAVQDGAPTGPTPKPKIFLPALDNQSQP